MNSFLEMFKNKYNKYSTSKVIPFIWIIWLLGMLSFSFINNDFKPIDPPVEYRNLTLLVLSMYVGKSAVDKIEDNSTTISTTTSTTTPNTDQSTTTGQVDLLQ